MAKVKCNSCGATFNTVQRDGMLYTHACPDTMIDQHAVCDPLTGKVITEATFKPVANPRNENFKPHPDRPFEYVIISEGSGVTEVE